jgi:hypothetical protein
MPAESPLNASELTEESTVGPVNCASSKPPTSIDAAANVAADVDTVKTNKHTAASVSDKIEHSVRPARDHVAAFVRTAADGVRTLAVGGRRRS